MHGSRSGGHLLEFHVEDPHRRQCCWYHGDDWRAVNVAAVRLVLTAQAAGRDKRGDRGARRRHRAG